MAQVRFLDQVPVGVFDPNTQGGGGQSVNIYYSGSLVLPNVPFINFTGSLDVFTGSLSGSNGVTVKVVGFPYSGSAEITGSLIISGSGDPILLVYGNSVFSGSVAVSGSINASSFTGSLFGTSSYAVSASQAISASYAFQATSASYALSSSYASGSTSASFANNIASGLNITASNIRVTGTASISYLDVTIESASVIYSSGSNQFGDAANDTQTMYGTVNILTGPLNVSGAATFYNGITGSLSGSVTGSFSGSVIAPGSTTQIVYNSGSVLGADSGFVYSGSNVGIGTTSPTSKLQVNGLSSFIGSGASTLGSTSSNAAAQFYQSGLSGVLAIGGYSNGGGEIQTYQNGGISLGGAIWLQRQAGVVSIGNDTNNAAKLTIKGSGATSSTTSLLVQNSAGNNSLQVFDDRTSTFGNNVTITPQASGGNIYLGLDSANMMRILDGGGYNKFQIQRGASGGAVSLYGGSQGGTSLISNDNGHQFSYPDSNFATASVSINRDFRGNIQNNTLNLLYLTSTNLNTLSNAPLLRGVYFAPTTTDWTEIRAFQSTAGGGYFNTTSVQASAILQADSTTKGFLLPRTNLTSNISSPAQGLQTYITSSATEGIWYYNSGSYQGWTRVLNDSGSQSITGSLTVTGGITGSFSGSGFITSASFASTASYVNPLTQSVLIRGLGTTSATTALSVQNANASSSLVVLDNGFVGVNTGSAQYNLDVNGTAKIGATSIASGNSSLVLITTNRTLSFNLSGTGGTFSSISTGLNSGTGAGSVGFSLDGYGTKFLIGPNNSIASALFSVNLNSGNAAQTEVIIGTQNENASSMLTLNSTVRGFLPPRTNLTSNISSPAQGLITYLTGSTNEGLYYYNSGSYQGWTKILNNSGSQSITGSLSISGSAGTGSALTVYKSGSTVVDVQGSQGQLFSITDSLSGSLFSVSNISGLPILEVFSDNTTLIGNYIAPALYTTNKITSTTLGANVVYSLATASYDGVFVDYTVRSGSNARAGNFAALWSGSQVNYMDNSTTDFGDTSGVFMSGSVSGYNMVVFVSASAGWTFKGIIRSI